MRLDRKSPELQTGTSQLADLELKVGGNIETPQAARLRCERRRDREAEVVEGDGVWEGVSPSPLGWGLCYAFSPEKFSFFLSWNGVLWYILRSILRIFRTFRLQITSFIAVFTADSLLATCHYLLFPGNKERC